MGLEWREFGELAVSTGLILLAVIFLWMLLALVIYWAIRSGTTSMKEEVKYRIVEDDKPLPHA
jgi:hypothetical protein